MRRARGGVLRTRSWSGFLAISQLLVSSSLCLKGLFRHDNALCHPARA